MEAIWLKELMILATLRELRSGVSVDLGLFIVHTSDNIAIVDRLISSQEAASGGYTALLLTNILGAICTLSYMYVLLQKYRIGRTKLNSAVSLHHHILITVYYQWQKLSQYELNILYASHIILT